MRHISAITKEEFLDLVKLVLPSGLKVNPQEWNVLDYGEEPVIAIHYEAE